ncbi:hypothetical protein GJAV_G00254400 [Gymnothorax javanicus]|nr:hypothetical protein GJAV_G00254400 [Gymnothorax javanicus]
MGLLCASLCLLITLHLGSAAPTHHDIMMADHHEDHHDNDKPDRCAGIEFDAIAPDENGTAYFFKGDYLWKDYMGQAVHINTSFEELDDHHHLDHVDAAFRMHSGSDPDDHDHIFFFLNEKVFSYYNHTLEPGFPKDIKDEFPGIPDHLDAAIECPKGECNEDAVIFFKGDDIYHYDITTKTAKPKKWPQVPKCTSAYRWLERYYCFHGHNFTRFHPLTGDVGPQYPKDARNYFMKCPGFGHGGTPRTALVPTWMQSLQTTQESPTHSEVSCIYAWTPDAMDGTPSASIASGRRSTTMSMPPSLTTESFILSRTIRFISTKRGDLHPRGGVPQTSEGGVGDRGSRGRRVCVPRGTHGADHTRTTHEDR